MISCLPITRELSEYQWNETSALSALICAATMATTAPMGAIFASVALQMASSSARCVLASVNFWLARPAVAKGCK